jgi:hypothetical protein
MPVDVLLGQTPSSLHADWYRLPANRQFLAAKQLYALQLGLAVYTGADAGSRQAAFAVISVEHSDEETVFRGRVRIDALTEKIKACSNCCSAA